VKIIVNGEEISIPEDSNIQDLVAELGYKIKESPSKLMRQLFQSRNISLTS
jgi:hypothetical protein